jgi:hypothetical protein
MANYPSSASTDANLYVAVNSLATSLAGALTSSGGNNGSDIEVVSTAGFPATGFITIDQEAISYTSLLSAPPRFSGIVRGADGTIASAHSGGSTTKHNVIAAHHNVLKEEVKAIETDLVGINASITPVTATNTSTSLLNRIAMIVNQIKVGFGLTNWYDTISAAVLVATDQSIAGIKTFTGQLIGKGTATNDSASAGYIGEYISSVVGLTNAPTSGNYGDLTSISLTAGDWDVTGIVHWDGSGSTATSYLGGISTTSGNSGTGLTVGDNESLVNPTAGFPINQVDNIIPAYRVSIASTTTYYLKFRSVYVVTPVAYGRLSARRVR